jgi:hypothetical protein
LQEIKPFFGFAWTVTPRQHTYYSPYLILHLVEVSFQPLKTLPEYPVKSRNHTDLFHKIRPIIGLLFTGKCCVDAWNLASWPAIGSTPDISFYLSPIFFVTNIFRKDIAIQSLQN